MVAHHQARPARRTARRRRAARPLPRRARCGAPPRDEHVAPLAGKTRFARDEEHAPGMKKATTSRKALKEFQAKVTKWILVVAARIKLYYLRERARSRPDKGRRYAVWRPSCCSRC